jgi:hypothetical protein
MTRHLTIGRLPAALLLVWVALAWSVWSSGAGRIDRVPVATPKACPTSAGAVPCS